MASRILLSSKVSFCMYNFKIVYIHTAQCQKKKSSKRVNLWNDFIMICASHSSSPKLGDFLTTAAQKKG